MDQQLVSLILFIVFHNSRSLNLRTWFKFPCLLNTCITRTCSCTTDHGRSSENSECPPAHSLAQISWRSHNLSTSGCQWGLSFLPCKIK